MKKQDITVIRKNTEKLKLLAQQDINNRAFLTIFAEKTPKGKDIDIDMFSGFTGDYSFLAVCFAHLMQDSNDFKSAVLTAVELYNEYLK